MDTVKLACDKKWVAVGAVAEYSESFSESDQCALSRHISNH